MITAIVEGNRRKYVLSWPLGVGSKYSKQPKTANQDGHSRFCNAMFGYDARNISPKVIEVLIPVIPNGHC
jgi:hypothetical protein